MKNETKKPFYKKWWFILIATVFIIGAIGNAFESDEKKQERENEKIAEEQKKEEENKQKDLAKKEEEERKANRSIDEAIQEDNKNVDKATLKDGLLTIERNPGTVWDENSLFMTVYDLFEVMKEAFKDDSVQEIEANVITTMVDNKGNETERSVISFIYTKESFDELNYEKFSDMAFSEQWRILNESDIYTIHPGIYKELKDKYINNLTNGPGKVS